MMMTVDASKATDLGFATMPEAYFADDHDVDAIYAIDLGIVTMPEA